MLKTASNRFGLIGLVGSNTGSSSGGGKMSGRPSGSLKKIFAGDISGVAGDRIDPFSDFGGKGGGGKRLP